MDEHKTGPALKPPPTPCLPARARLPINRCNLPAAILGGLMFQAHPTDLQIDGVAQLHWRLFRLLDESPSAEERRTRFRDYMRLHFLLDHPEDAGYDASAKTPGRVKADYLRVIRGWMFDADGREAAVLKAWVESRFGLLPRNHKGPLTDFDSARYFEYLESRSRGLYNTNALEAQLDLLFTFCQYELQRSRAAQSHLTLFRGVNALHHYERMASTGPRRHIILFNNLNSFTGSRERADEFGDHVLECRVPCAKILFYPGLLGALLQGEDEYLVIGGLYEVQEQAL